MMIASTSSSNSFHLQPDATGERRAEFLRACFLPIAATICAALPLFRHVGWVEFMSLAGVFLLTTGVALLQYRPAPASLTQTPQDVSSANDTLRVLLVAVLPVWQRHLHTVREQTEGAVSQLITSFSSMIDQFDAAGFGNVGWQTEAGHENAALGLMAMCERELGPVIGSLEQLIGSKDALLQSVRTLGAAVNEMTGMAEDVSLVAAHTNMLAINAAIEAARAGPAGRGFAVVAGEVRKLSVQSADSGKRIGKRVHEITDIAKQTLMTAAQAAESDKAALSGSGDVVQEVLDQVRMLGTATEKMRSQGQIIRRDVENLLVNLQYQDRVNQIIDVIQGDIARLIEQVAQRHAQIPSAKVWLADLSKNYTMDEERRSHGELTGVASTQRESEQDVTFF